MTPPASPPLLPCPWCNAPPKVVGRSGQVYCDNDDCPQFSAALIDPERWNRRASTAKFEEALEKILVLRDHPDMLAVSSRAHDVLCSIANEARAALSRAQKGPQA